jgi:hypothetical protein
VQLAEDDVRNLDQQPADDQVGERRLEDTATPEILEEADVAGVGAVFRAEDDGSAVISSEHGVDSEPVPSPRQRLDKHRVVGAVAQRMANLADGVTQGLRAAVARSPALFEQFFARNQFAGGSRETQQHFHGFGRQVRGSCSSRDLTFQGFYEEFTKIEAL